MTGMISDLEMHSLLVLPEISSRLCFVIALRACERPVVAVSLTQVLIQARLCRRSMVTLIVRTFQQVFHLVNPDNVFLDPRLVRRTETAFRSWTFDRYFLMYSLDMAL